MLGNVVKCTFAHSVLPYLSIICYYCICLVAYWNAILVWQTLCLSLSLLNKSNRNNNNIVENATY